MKLNELMLYTAPDVIADEGVRLINNLLTSYKEQPWMGERKYMPPLPPDFEFLWVTTDGKFTKRVSKYYFETFGIKLPDDVISAIGNLAREHSSVAVTYRFQIVDKIEWQDGDFGDDGSCYWSVRAAAKDMITDNGGYAICFFKEDGGGIGRAWLYNTGDFWVIWNGYGFNGNPTLIISRMFAQWQGLRYTRIYLTNNSSTDNTLFINGGVGYVIAPNPVGITSYDFGWPEYFNCLMCEKRIDGEQVHYCPDYEAYCATCFQAEFYICGACGRAADRSDMPDATANDQPLCYSCNQNQQQVNTSAKP